MRFRTLASRPVFAPAKGLAALLLAAGMLQPGASWALNNPPKDPFTIIAFPQRDFVSGDGYADDDQVVVRVIHDQTLYPGATGGTTDPNNPISPQAGLVEVNHPGGACWFGQTPDIRPGDRVQYEVVAGTHAGRIDETTVRNITAQRPVVGSAPGQIVIHGTAQEADGTPLDINLLENRLVAPGNLFALSGKRTLRATNAAGSNGTLVYDAPGSTHWTATYNNLTDGDIALALGADSRGMWLGNAVLPAVETTVYEIGPLTFAGPQAPCSAPLEVLPPPPGSELNPPSAPSGLSFVVDGSNSVTLTWTGSSDDTGVTGYVIFRGGDNSAQNLQPIFELSKPDGTAYANGQAMTFLERNVPPGSYFYQVRATDAVGNRSDGSNIVGPVNVTAQTDPLNLPLCSSGSTGLCINDPPSPEISIIAFPSRDFVSPSGYQADDKVTVQVLRREGNRTIVVSSAEGITPVDTDGVFFAEVNHPGGACWEGVTPDIRVGDIIRTIAYNEGSKVPGSNPDGIRSIDQTTVAGVVASRPIVVRPATGTANNGIVEIHGTALGADGLPIPIDQIEQRMIANRDAFDFNGRRAARASSVPGPGFGTLSYDAVDNPMGIKWTARYANLNGDDVARMVGGRSVSTGTQFPGADTRIHWLGRDPLLLNEATIYENSDLNPPGPAAPGCTRPLEVIDTTAPSQPGNGVLAAENFNVGATGSVKLDWTASSDNWSVAGYRVYVDGVAVANTGPQTTTYTLTGIIPGNHTYGVAAFDKASPTGAGATASDRIIAGFGKLYGNLSTQATRSLAMADVVAPSVPTNLLAQETVTQTGTSVSLAWTASTDNVAVTGYTVYRNGVPLGTAGGPSFTDTSAPVGERTYTVDAVDAAGNHSAQSVGAVIVVNEPPAIAVSPAPVQFGTVNLRDAVTQNVVVRNSSGPFGLALKISGAVISGTTDFTKTADGCTNASLAPGATCTITIQLQPTVSAGRTATLTISHNAGSGSTPVSLTGTAVSSVLTLGSTSITFGTVNRLTSKDQTISIRNSGTATTTPLAFAVNGTGYSVVPNSSTCGSGLAPNKSCNVVVRFTAPNTLGSFPGGFAVSATNANPQTASATLSATTK